MRAVLDQTDGRAATKITSIFRKYKGRMAGGMKLASKQDPHSKLLVWRVESAGPEPAADM